MKILNPLGEDTSIMRTTTLPSMPSLHPQLQLPQQVRPSYELGRTYFAKRRLRHGR